MLQRNKLALASMAQLVTVSSHYLRIVGSIPGQGIDLGCELDHWLGCIRKATN